ncbi:acyl carrier protein [Hallella multisaccharivorax]|uniref:acyl carrier protein n=1 Tax=Hallella multisaccharivorax TaxID=310514 RepID=UPI003610DB04
MKEEIKKMLEDILPLVDFDSDFLFSELDSLGITAILMTLSKTYDVDLEPTDVTPRNFRNLDSLVALVKSKQSVNGK